MSRWCQWCNGTGRIAVERGSSLAYRCQDCGGSGGSKGRCDTSTGIFGRDETFGPEEEEQPDTNDSTAT